MTSLSFLNLAFLCFFSLSLSQPHPTSGAASFPADDNHNGGAPPRSGLCPTVKKHGYKCKEFKVTTEDGYILAVHRIPGSRAGGGGNRRRQPVLLQHGVLMDGMVWIANPPKQSLAMILADKGFDVWISNIRGTRFSRQHRKLAPSDPKYWKWTWDDLILYDLPSIIGLIFKETGIKIHYVGHSMGTVMALASLSERRLANVKSAALLSPIAYLSHVKTDITIVAARAFIGELGAIFGLAEFNPKGESESKFLKFLCSLVEVDCNELKTTSITGRNCCLNDSVVDNFIKNDPQPTSTKNLVQFAQAIRHGSVCKYDYGNLVENIQHYGQITAPMYNLSNIPRNFPLFLSYGGEDKLSDVRDVRALLYDIRLHQKKKLRVQFIKKYAHLDFVLGVNAKDLIYNHIVDFFNRHK